IPNSTDLRRPCTPSGGQASAVLAHPLTNGLAPVLGARPPAGAPGHRVSRRIRNQSSRATAPVGPDRISTGSVNQWSRAATPPCRSLRPQGLREPWLRRQANTHGLLVADGL